MRRRPTIFILSLICFLLGAFHVRAGSLGVVWDPNSEGDLMGYKVYYGTSSRHYTTVVDVGNVTHYRVDNLTEGVRYFFAVTAYDSARNESNFSEEVSAVVADRTAPTISSVQLLNATTLELTFSEPVERASAETTSNYRINNGISVLAATLDSSCTVVRLLTTPHTTGVAYAIMVQNIHDQAFSPNTISPYTSYTYTYAAALAVSNINHSDYRLAYVKIGNEYYVDQTVTTAIIPPEVENLLWIMTANGDRTSTGDSFLTFQVNTSVKVYVGYDSRIPTIPKWLWSWKPLDLTIEDSRGVRFALFSRSFSQGEVALGGNYGDSSYNMYIVLIDPTEKSEPNNIPEHFLLYQNYPNPFNPGTEIMFTLPQDGWNRAGRVTLGIYNLLGQEVKRLVDRELPPGVYFIPWDGTDEKGQKVPSGTYFYQLKAGPFSQMKKMLLMK